MKKLYVAGIGINVGLMTWDAYHGDLKGFILAGLTVIVFALILKIKYL